MLIRRTTLPATLIALVVLLATAFVGTPRAEATSTLLCKGFRACTQAGYSHHGYASNYRKMWWRMYAGHNCTNYVAYRMVRNGMSATRPWSGSGDARNWGRVFASRTNQTPTVGSIAWWSSNHVAYVEQVVDADTIVISEDHWGGNFDWRKIVRAGGGWPTGFIHLNDEVLKPTAVPRISGTPKVDQPLAATPGTWNQSGATYTYQWLANGAAVPGATRSTFTPTAGQVNTRLSVRVTAVKSGYRSAASVSPVTAATAPGTMAATEAPTVTGVPKVGGVLTMTGGAFAPAATTSAISWRADGVPIPGANRATLRLGPDQLDRQITAVVTGQRAGYAAGAATSAATAPVGPERLTMTRQPRLADRDPLVGRAIAVVPGVVGPSGVEVAYQWFRGDRPIRGAVASTYTPSADVIGQRLSVRVTHAKPGYTSIVRMLGPTKVVQARPGIRVRSTDPGRVTVSLFADGLPKVGGRVVIVDARGHRATRKLRGSSATFRADWLRPGRQTFTVEFLGSFRAEARTALRAVTVR